MLSRCRLGFPGGADHDGGLGHTRALAAAGMAVTGSRSAYEGEVQLRDHGQERIVNE